MLLYKSGVATASQFIERPTQACIISTRSNILRACLASLDRLGGKQAIRLSRKDWHFSANRALVCAVPGQSCAPGSCPAGYPPAAGLRW